jgi:hypothetical protein
MPFLLIMKKALDRLVKSFLWRIDDHTHLKGFFMFGKHCIRYNFDERGAEIEVYDPLRDVYLDRVAECLKEALYNR